MSGGKRGIKNCKIENARNGMIKDCVKGGKKHNMNLSQYKINLGRV